MVQFPPYVLDLIRDGWLGGRDIAVWILAAKRLDFYDFRELKPSDLANEFQPAFSPRSIRRSQHRLVVRGYLEVSEQRGPRGERLYRVPLNRVYPRSIVEKVLNPE